ncbi:MAG: GTPase Era [Methylicorpusculum sp.]|jgi:GTP-binding protein Era|uniref:GTPase Era n=1 Tax=Methylicorpusculum TaxID=2713642 RepID=UPI001358CFB5|nr:MULTISPECIES: GTPase Era [Methylicorpusculum]MCD2449075.1 GTPase Era [Methylicorpusculum oleiharenae]MDO8845545.1 GTPase Era [Methylicorpusculum sp.]MDO8938960.1 GTPase Era [Methylicorpusculum sp.]MDO9239066.1 GTPase Era [Methylicorpusculum sp.]MDP2179302.1 GTPase Era [Methylicorpusculum sp.]
MNCGYVALVGRPNVGKSTLMNHLLGQKISITSRKPQTTRHRILGINTTDEGQAIYMDTPGMHNNEKKALNRYLNRTAESTLAGVDVVVWLIDGLAWQEYDDVIFAKLKQAGLPAILAVNKVDKVKDKDTMLAFFAEAQARFPFEHIVPISALKNTNLQMLESLIMKLLPERELIYPADQITDRPERFLCAEIVREKLTRRLGDELPYALTVEIERYEEHPTLSKIYAIIWVERNSQKSIVIGKQGEMLKNIGTDARHDIERLIGQKVYLQLWVKVKHGWSDNERALQSLGFNE